MCGILKKVFSPESLVGDLRSAIVGAVFGVFTSIFAQWLFASPVREYTVLLNDNGYGKPSGLFEYAQQQDPKLKLKFEPPEFKDVFVCEYKLVTAASWRRLVLSYLDSYRECFDVSPRNENEYVISPNLRTSLLKKIGANYMCKCNH